MRYLALLLIGWLSLPVYALTQVDIYRAEVAIDGEQKDGEELARQQGMQDVIVRATGSQSSLSNPVIKKAVGSSSRYISQLGYGQMDGQSSLKMLFNSGQIRSLLTQAQLPLWSPNRANILVWMVEEQGYDRTITWEHSDSTSAATLRDAAQARGLPITMPVGDFDDVTGVNVSDLWGDFVDPISQASQRYPVDAVLIVRVQGDKIRWTLYDQSPAQLSESKQSPRSGSASGANAIPAMVGGIADYYAKKSAVVVSSKSSEAIDVKVLSVSSAMDFFELENSLTKLSSVAGAEIKRIQGNQVTLTIHLLASQQAFEQEVSSIRSLEVTEDPMAGMEEVVPAQLPEEPAQPTQLPATTEDAQAAEVVDLNTDTAQPEQPVVVKPAPEQYDLIYKWNAPVRTPVEPEENSEIAPVLETDVVEDLN
ncbi:DUF2066 domain-containing protein [Vibrio owensii]|uniref:DUF2066 domain-containing protein n=1 Tax=Vibrio owensii TaxID=696485 RepID=A0AAP9K9A3_9VIBR|nr:DUF2066 domain-containing protein [Vibrio owensii]AQW58848.1 hypothetical protein A9237_12640 [Vibrio owensii]AYO13685.1 DUF2066 domain-containing protein [Vibrio owensii]MDA0380888.1 DUF2066 domain-containing protein [Vibrio owensii]QGH46359.1 DUF2066 domain-containing protein [Vibrio owensii]